MSENPYNGMPISSAMRLSETYRAYSVGGTRNHREIRQFRSKARAQTGRIDYSSLQKDSANKRLDLKKLEGFAYTIAQHDCPDWKLALAPEESPES